MTNVVMIVRGRYQLTRQAIQSIYDNTPMDEFNLTVIDDASPLVQSEAIESRLHNNGTILRVTNSGHILGLLRNLGAYWSAEKHGQGEWLCFLDNDVAVLPGWVSKMNEQCQMLYTSVIGGCRHPFHHPLREEYDTQYKDFIRTDAVAGYSMLMRWSTWELFGPFDADFPGIGRSEDFSLCQRVKASGGIVGYVDPPVLSHCGITNTDGKPATGADQFPRVPGLLYL